MKNNNKGITVVALTITIVVLLIVAGITSYSGLHTVKSARFYNAESQMKIINSKVSELYDEYKDGNTAVLNYGMDSKQEGYRIYTKEFIKQKFNIEGIDYDFLVNVKDRKVELEEGIQYQGKSYFTLEDFGINNVPYSGD